jgi:hypothetical protein
MKMIFSLLAVSLVSSAYAADLPVKAKLGTAIQLRHGTTTTVPDPKDSNVEEDFCNLPSKACWPDQRNTSGG